MRCRGTRLTAGVALVAAALAGCGGSGDGAGSSDDGARAAGGPPAGPAHGAAKASERSGAPEGTPEGGTEGGSEKAGGGGGPTTSAESEHGSEGGAATQQGVEPDRGVDRRPSRAASPQQIAEAGGAGESDRRVRDAQHDAERGSNGRPAAEQAAAAAQQAAE